MKTLIRFFLLTILVLTTSCIKKKELGSAGNPIKVFFTPSVDADTIATNSDDFVKFLKKETGYHYKVGIPTSYIAVVEAFGSGRADIGIFNSFGYLLAHDKYGAIAKLKVLRYGEDSYRGQIIARVDSGINNVKDINGKKFAYTDPSSTSGYLLPKKIFKEAGVTPSNTTFAGKHDNVVTMVYQKQVDAGATYYSPPSPSGEIRDARMRVKTQFPDVESKVKIIQLTDKIPNDPFVFRKDLNPDISTKFIAALKKYLTTPEGKKSFETMYAIEGVVDAEDSDYQVLRDMVKSLNLDTEKLAK